MTKNTGQESAEVKKLRTALSQSRGSKRTSVMLQLAILLFKENPEEALLLATQAEKSAKKAKQNYELALALKTIGNVHFNKNEPDIAKKYYINARKPAKQSQDNELLGDIYYNLSRIFTHKKDYTSALKNLQKSLEHRKNLPTRKEESAVLNDIGQVYWEMTDWEQAANYYAQSAALLDINTATQLQQAAVVYNNLGNALVKTGKTDEALVAYLNSLHCREKLANDKGLAVAYLSLGNLYFTCGEFAKAADYYIQAADKYAKTGETKQMASAFSNLGATYNELGKDRQALIYHKKALKVFEQIILPDEAAKTLNNIGSVYLKKKDLGKALDFYQKALAVKLKSKDNESLAITFNSIASVHCLTGELRAAAENFLLSEQYAAKAHNKKLLLENFSRLGDVFAALGEFEKAFEYLLRFREADLEYYSEKSLNKLTETMVRFDVELKSQEISQLTELQKIQKQMLDEQIKAKLRYMDLYRTKQKEVKKREQAQKALLELNHELELRIEKALAEYKLQQEVIIHKSKLESLGVLAAGIAHEIYQPLSAISISINNIKNKAQKNELNIEYLTNKFNRISEDIQRIRQVIEHVRLFSREQKNLQPERVDVCQTLKDTLRLIEYDLKRHGIKMNLIIPVCPLWTVGSKFKLEQVFLNLISNARDATMEKREAVGSFEPLIQIETSSQNGMILTVITDNGIGMQPEVVHKMFDPFFTTKNPEKGTGLGLSISYGIIKEAEGEIIVESKPGKYTTVKVKLPEVQEK